MALSTTLNLSSDPLLSGLTVLILTFVVSYSLIILTLAIINYIARLLLRNKEGELSTTEMIFWTIKETTWDIAQVITRKVIIHSPVPDFLCRFFGFKLRKGVSILGTLWDPEIIDIGENTLIGTRVMCTAHHIRAGKCFRKKIVIGRNCTIGIDSTILPGATIGDNVMVGAGSMIPPNWVLEGNSIYSGVPVKRVKDYNPNDNQTS